MSITKGMKRKTETEREVPPQKKKTKRSWRRFLSSSCGMVSLTPST